MYMDDVVRYVNATMLGRVMALVGAKCERFALNQLLHADDRALVAD